MNQLKDVVVVGKIIITGTGRCGSSFLVHLLSAMGLDTGYTEEYCSNELQNECRGGCEHTIDKPYKILKNPTFAENIEEIIQGYEIEHVIIPIRDLNKTALSREKNNDNHGGYGGYTMGAKSVEEQENKHARLVYNLIEKLTSYDIPYTTIHFPRIVEDKEYLYKKLNNVDGFLMCQFNESFDMIADKEKITV